MSIVWGLIIAAGIIIFGKFIWKLLVFLVSLIVIIIIVAIVFDIAVVTQVWEEEIITEEYEYYRALDKVE